MLATSVRSTDTVARLGGDEFAILLPSCTAMGGSAIAYEIINKIMNYHFMWDGRVYQIGASVGIVSFKSMELTMEKLLSHADVACYAAKHQGGNRVCFFADLNKDGTN
jgi:diguanylate cyclase (GGDEF)-like protein